MKVNNGIIRQMDEAGRLVFPIEIRRTNGWEDKDDFIMRDSFDESDGQPIIIVKKVNPSCVFCNSQEDLEKFLGRCVCRKCADKLYNPIVTKRLFK